LRRGEKDERVDVWRRGTLGKRKGEKTKGITTSEPGSPRGATVKRDPKKNKTKTYVSRKQGEFHVIWWF